MILKPGRGRHRKYRPYAFTEQGVAMLSSVLRSRRAVLVNIETMRTFVRLRQILTSHADMARKLDALEKKYDAQFKVVLDTSIEAEGLMTSSEPSTPRIPVICADPSAIAGAATFNPNPWSGASRGIVQSCWTEYSVLHHCVGQIAELCARSDQQCQTHLDTLQQQWRTARFDLEKVIVFGQVPDLHMRIESFLAGIKTLLDLLVQLLAGEKVVATIVDGFHRAQDVYGSKVLNALENNARANRRGAAAKIRALILEHKTLWIDEAIQARDQLIHPDRGMHQLMFRFDLAARGDTLVCERIHPPMIGAEAIDAYARRALKHAEAFSTEFLKVIREGV